MTDSDIPLAKPLKGLRLGKPTTFFFDDLEPEVASCMELALQSLREAGVEIIDIEIPDPKSGIGCSRL